MTLREELDAAAATHRTAETYRARLEELRDLHSHSIEIVESSDITRFNCYAFATGVSELPAYEALVDLRMSSALLDSAFVAELIESGDLREVESPVPDGLAIYFDGEKVTHAARVLNDPSRLRSKWGPLEVHEHGLWEVGANYGVGVRFYAPPDSEGILRRLGEALADDEHAR